MPLEVAQGWVEMQQLTCKKVFVRFKTFFLFLRSLHVSYQKKKLSSVCHSTATQSRIQPYVEILKAALTAETCVNKLQGKTCPLFPVPHLLLKKFVTHFSKSCAWGHAIASLCFLDTPYGLHKVMRAKCTQKCTPRGQTGCLCTTALCHATWSTAHQARSCQHTHGSERPERRTAAILPLTCSTSWSNHQAIVWACEDRPSRIGTYIAGLSSTLTWLDFL